MQVSHPYRTATLVLAAAFVTHLATLALQPESLPPAFGSVDTAGGYSVATARIASRGEGEAICVFRHEDQKLAIYYPSNAGLEVMATRNCTYDFQFRGGFVLNGRQKPTVSEMKALVK